MFVNVIFIAAFINMFVNFIFTVVVLVTILGYFIYNTQNLKAYHDNNNRTSARPYYCAGQPIFGDKCAVY